MGMANSARLVYWQVEPITFDLNASGVSVRVDDVLDILRHIKTVY